MELVLKVFQQFEEFILPGINESPAAAGSNRARPR